MCKALLYFIYFSVTCVSSQLLYAYYIQKLHMYNIYLWMSLDIYIYPRYHWHSEVTHIQTPHRILRFPCFVFSLFLCHEHLN